MDSSITALLNVGADAMDNLFDVVIELPNEISSEESVQNAFRLRCLGFTPPQFKVGFYDVKYKTIKVRRPKTVVEGDRVFDLQFRLDANYSQYKQLAAWRARTMIPSLGYARNDLTEMNGTADSLATVKVVALAQAIPGLGAAGVEGMTDSKAIPDSIGDVKNAIWTFQDVWLFDLSEPSYKQGNGDTIAITAKFAFGAFKDPYHNWKDLGDLDSQTAEAEE